MNDAQHRAATKVAAAKERQRQLARELCDVDRAVKRAEAALRREIRRDPDAWNTVAALPAGYGPLWNTMAAHNGEKPR